MYEKGGKLHGKVVKLLKKGPDTRCDKCSGAKKDQLIVGMNVVEGMSAEDGMWKVAKSSTRKAAMNTLAVCGLKANPTSCACAANTGRDRTAPTDGYRERRQPKGCQTLTNDKQ